MKDETYIPDEGKIRLAKDLEKLPDTIFISSGKLWHLGKKNLQRGVRSGLALRAVYLTACSGKQLGGPWGYTKSDELPTGALLCSRCDSIITNNKANL